MKLRTRSAGIDLEQLRDFVVLVAFHVVQDEYLACAAGQLRDRALDRHTQVGPLDRCAHVIQQRFVIVMALPRDTESLPAAQHQVDRHAMQPGREARLAREGMQLLPHADENFLHRIIGFSRIEQPAGETRDLRHVTPVQPLERVMITRGCQGDVVSVEVGVGHGA